MAENIKDMSENIEEHPEDTDPTSTHGNKIVDSECVVLADQTQCSGDDVNDQYKINSVEHKCNDKEIKIETNDKVDEKCNIEQGDSDNLMQEKGTEQNENTKSKEGTCNDEIDRCTTDASLEQSKTLQSAASGDDIDEKNDSPEACDMDSPTVSKKPSPTTQTDDDDDSDEDIYLYMYPNKKKEGELSIYAFTECQGKIS